MKRNPTKQHAASLNKARRFDLGSGLPSLHISAKLMICCLQVKREEEHTHYTD